MVSGEKLTSIPDAPSGYVWVDGDGNEPSTTTAITESITYTAKLIVATIGDTNYTSLQAAITAAGTTTTTTITLQADTTENITISSNVTIDLNGKTLTGTVTNNGTVIDGTYTITAAEDSSTTINTDGTMTLNAGATVQYGSNTTVVTVGENSTASYSSGSITVADDNYLTYGTTIITAGTVGVGYNEIGSESATVNGYEIKGFSGNGFSVSSTGKVTLTSGLFYSVEGVTISTADGDMTLDTTDNDGIALDNGTVVHGYTLTGGVITTNGVTATTAVYTSGNDTVTITGDLSVTEDGVKSTSGTFTVSYDEGVTSITLDEKATADKDGKVTANVIITGAYPDTVAYTADEGTNITIETTGVASYPSGTVITDGDYTITWVMK